MGDSSLLTILETYGLRVAPSCVIAFSTLFFLPKRFVEIRIFVYILIFILFRDAMTPVGLWRFGTDQFFWMRFIESIPALIVLATFTIGLIFFMNRMDPELRELLVWKKKAWPLLAASGFVGALVIAAPSLALNYGVPIAERGGPVPSELIPIILIFSLVGNCYEEILFRGYFQGYVEKFVSPWKSVVLSGLVFSFGHIFLATTVTNAGWIILAFTLYEGLIAAFLRRHFGLSSAAIAHGGGIFLIAAGLR